MQAPVDNRQSTDKRLGAPHDERAADLVLTRLLCGRERRRCGACAGPRNKNDGREDCE